MPKSYSLRPVKDDRARVDAERDRRIAEGVAVSLSTGKTFTMQTRPGDIQSIQALVTVAQVQWARQITFRDTDNNDQEMTPDEMIEAGMAAFAHVDAHYKAGWALKDTDPIPADYADDAHWP
jgi:hypothetical protein